MTDGAELTGLRGVRPAVWVSLFLILAVVGGIRYRLLDLPLERDEGEFAYMGQLMLDGVPPYAEAYNMKFPGIYASYALLEGIFGETTRGIHLGLLLVNAATILLLFVLGRRLADSEAGVIAAWTYGLLSLSPSMLGLAGHATHFVLLPVIGGLLLLLRSFTTGRLWQVFASGLLFGLGILMKQPAALFALFAFVLAVRPHRESGGANTGSALAALIAGILLPVGITCAWLAASGVFGRFWFWTVTYAGVYGTELPLEGGIQLLTSKAAKIFDANAMLAVVFLLSLVTVFLGKVARFRRFFLGLLLLFSFAAICPGFYFREHYFILLLPGVALITGTAASGMMQKLRQSVPVLWPLPALIVLLAGVHALWQQREVLFEDTPTAASRALYGLNPFPEAVDIADSIRAMTSPGERIAVIGSEPEIYFYAHRRGATGYIYMYSLMEPQPYAVAMQHEAIAQMEAGKPAVMVYVNHHTSWLSRPSSPADLMQWAAGYLQANYDLVGLIDMIDARRIVRRWHGEARSSSPASPDYVAVFRRKSGV